METLRKTDGGAGTGVLPAGAGASTPAGGELFRKAELGTGAGLSGAAGPEPVEPPPPGVEDFAADRPNRTGGAGSGLVGWVIRAGHRDESAQSADAVIVLGAGVNGTTPSVALQTRIDAAERYLKAHPDIPAVLSGGQGPGEDISEARAMYNALTDRGIDPERLILEEQSANTRQNLQNSLALLPDDYHKTVAIVTNDFHMGRVRLLLNAAGPGRVVQVPAKLPWWWLSANYYLRESFAVVNDQVVRPLLA